MHLTILIHISPSHTILISLAISLSNTIYKYPAVGERGGRSACKRSFGYAGFCLEERSYYVCIFGGVPRRGHAAASSDLLGSGLAAGAVLLFHLLRRHLLLSQICWLERKACNQGEVGGCSNLLPSSLPAGAAASAVSSAGGSVQREEGEVRSAIVTCCWVEEGYVTRSAAASAVSAACAAVVLLFGVQSEEFIHCCAPEEELRRRAVAGRLLYLKKG